MAQENPLKTLYQSLKDNNYDVPDTYDSFEYTLTLPGDEGKNNRQALYQSLRDNNYDVPDTYESFDYTLFGTDEPTDANDGGGATQTQQAGQWKYMPMFDMQSVNNAVREDGMTNTGRYNELQREHVLMPFGAPTGKSVTEQYDGQKGASEQYMGWSGYKKRRNDEFFGGFGGGKLPNYFEDVASANKKYEEADRKRQAARREYDDANFEGFYQENVKPVFEAQRAEGEKRGAEAQEKMRPMMEQALGNPNAGAQLGMAMQSMAAREREIDPKKIAENTVKAVEQGRVDEYVLGRMGFNTDRQTDGDGEQESAPLTDEEKMLFNDLYGKEVGEVSDMMIARMYQEYKDAGVPEGELQYILGKAVHDNVVATLMKAMIGRMAGSSGLREQFRQEAYQSYGADADWWTKMAGSAAPFAVDVATGGFALPSLAGKGAVKGVTNWMARNVAKRFGERAAGEVAKGATKELASAALNRYLQTNAPVMSILLNSIGGAANFGTYEMQNEAIRQFGQGEFEPMQLLNAFGHGAALGGVMGVAGNSIAQLTKGMGVGGKIVGDIAGVGSETAIFATDRALEKAKEDGVSILDVDWADIAGESLGMVLGMKAVGGLMSPKALRERYTKSPDYDLKFDERNRKELEDAGYDFRNIFKGMNENVGDLIPLTLTKRKEIGETSPLLGEEKSGEVEVNAEALEDLMKNPAISSETKRKVFYLATGKILAPEGVFHADMEVNEDGSATITTYNVAGDVIGVKDYEDVRDAEKVYRERQAESRFNKIYGFDLLFGSLGISDAVANRARRLTEEETGVDVRDLLRKPSNSRTDGENAIVDAYIKNMQDIAMEMINADKLRIAVDNYVRQGRNMRTPEEVHENAVTIRVAGDELAQMEGGEEIKSEVDKMFRNGTDRGELSQMLNELNPEQREVANRYIEAVAKGVGVDMQATDEVRNAVEAERKRLEPYIRMNAFGEPSLFPVALGERRGYITDEEGDNVTVMFEDSEQPEVMSADNSGLTKLEPMLFDDYMANFEKNAAGQVSAEVENARVNHPLTKLEPVVGDVIETMDGKQRVAYVGEDGRVLLEPDEYTIDVETGQPKPVSRGKFTGDDLISVDEFVNKQNAYYEGKDIEAREAEKERIVATQSQQTEPVEVADYEQKAENGEMPVQGFEAEERRPARENLAARTEGEDYEPTLGYEGGYDEGVTVDWREEARKAEQKKADDELVGKLVQKDEKSAGRFVKNNLDAIEAELKKAQKKESKATDFDVFEKETAEFEAEVQRLEAEKARWEGIQKRVKDERLSMQKDAAEEAVSEKKVSELGEPLSLREWIMRSLYNGGYKMIWGDDEVSGTRGLGSHLGMRSEAERKQRFWMTANRDKGGFYPEEVAEKMLRGYADDMGWEGTDGDWNINSQDVLDELLDVVRSYGKRVDLGNAAVEAHQKAEETNKQKEREEEQYLKEEWAKGMGFNTYEDYEAYEADAEKRLAVLDDNVWNELQNIIAEDYEQRRNSEGGTNGTEMVSEPEVIDTEGTGSSAEGQGGVEEGDGKGNGNLSEESGEQVAETGEGYKKEVEKKQEPLSETDPVKRAQQIEEREKSNNVKPRRDIETDEVFKANHSDEEQERMRYVEGETFEDYCKRNGIEESSGDAAFYFYQKYADRWENIEKALAGVNEDPRAAGFTVGQMVDSQHEGFAMFEQLMKQIDPKSVTKFYDGVADGYEEKKEKQPLTQYEAYEKEQDTVDERGGLVKNELADGILSESWRGALHVLGRNIGRRIEILSGEDTRKRFGNGVQGFYDKSNNTLYLNEDYVKDNENLRNFVLGHEMTHILKSENPEVWNAYVGTVKAAMGDEFQKEFDKKRERYDSFIEKYNRTHERKLRKLSDAEIEEEVCSDWAGRNVLTDEESVKKIIADAEKAGADPVSLTKRILDAINQWLTQLKQALKNAVGKADEIADNIKFAEQAKKLWQDMYNVAVARQNAKMDKATAEDVKFSLEEQAELDEVNERFNQELDDFKDKKHKGLMHLGKPLKILQACGVNAKELTLSPTILHNHLKKQGLTVDNLKGLAKSIQTPIFVYKHGKNFPNMVVVTEMDVNGGKLSASLELDKNGNVVEISNIKSIHSKDAMTEMERLSNFSEEELKNALRWVDKEKVSDWLLRLPYEDERTKTNPKHISIAKVIQNFENPKLFGEKISEEHKFSLDDEERTLMGVHNISEEKLKKALKVGGLANPSMAVLDTDNYTHTDYGEISLIPRSSLIDARTGRNAGTFTADAWTPTYPPVQKRMTNKGQDQFWKDMHILDDEPRELYSKTRMAFDSWLDGRNTPERLAFWFLKEKGIEPERVYNESGIPAEEKEAFKSIVGEEGKEFYDLTPEEREKVLPLIAKSRGETVEEMLDKFQQLKKRNQELLQSDPKFKVIKQRAIEAIDEYGITLGAARDYFDKMRSAFRYDGTINDNATISAAANQVKKQGLEKEFDQWIADKEKKYGIEEWLWNGTDYQGRDRWLRNTLENASKLMNRQGLNGAKNWSGIGNWIAKVANKEKTLEGIRKYKGNLSKSLEEHEAFQDKWTEILHDIALKIAYNGDILSGENRMSDALEHKNPADYIKKEYGVDLSKKDRQMLDTFIKEVRENFPTGYFETKFDRPVGLDEFAVAVVPENTSPEVVEALRNAGLDVRTYNNEGTEEENNEARRAAVMDAVSGRDDILFSLADEEPFYSNAERAVEGIKQEKATPEQWLKMIEKNGGLKAGEDKWMGLSDWLKESDKKTLTKDEVLDYIRKNEIQIEEVNYGELNNVDGNEKMKELKEEFAQIQGELTSEKENLEREIAEFDEEMYEKYGEGWYNQLTGKEREYADAIENRYRNLDDSDDAAFREMVSRYGDDFEQGFEVVGGELEPVNDYYEGISGAARYFLDINDKPINSTRMDYTTEGLDNKREIALVVPSVESWNAGDEIHFGDAGEGRAVAWVRFGDTTDKDGDKVLVIDEIQSKRHQEGREKGYKKDIPANEPTKLKHEAAKNALDDYLTALRKKYDRDDVSYGLTEEERGKLDKLHDEEIAARLDYNKYLQENKLGAFDESGVPDAPFDKNWHELAMKRMFRYAAENGYDKVAWTKGEQQAERYSLGKVYNSVEREDNPSQEGKRFVFSGENLDVMRVDDEGKVISSTIGEADGKKLSDLVGKDLAGKMMSMENGDMLDSEELRIGGEGMKGFYDQILPRFMDKYGKKWGVKTGEVELPELEESAQKMWSVDVTPEMRESVMKGQPMFSLADEPLSEYDPLKRAQQIEERKAKVESVRSQFDELNKKYKGRKFDAVEDRDDILFREGNGAVTPAKPVGSYRPTKRQREAAAKRGTRRFFALVDKMGLSDKVHVYESGEDYLKAMGIEKPTADDMRKARAKGWFDPKTKQIYVIANNNVNLTDALKTLLHEGVAHYGLRELVGKENFEQFLTDVYDNSVPEIKEKIDEIAEKLKAKSKKKHSDQYYRNVATEEFMAKTAQEMDFENESPSSWSQTLNHWWNKIRDLFFKMMHKLGKGTYNGSLLSENEIKYLLWRSWKNLTEPGRYKNPWDATARAEDKVMQDKLGVPEEYHGLLDRNKIVAVKSEPAMKDGYTRGIDLREIESISAKREDDGIHLNMKMTDGKDYPIFISPYGLVEFYGNNEDGIPDKETTARFGKLFGLPIKEVFGEELAKRILSGEEYIALSKKKAETKPQTRKAAEPSGVQVNKAINAVRTEGSEWLSDEMKDKIADAAYKIRERASDAVALVQTPKGYVMVGKDAKLMRNMFGLDNKPYVTFPVDKLSDVLPVLIRAGHRAAVVDIADENGRVRESEDVLDAYDPVKRAQQIEEKKARIGETISAFNDLQKRYNGKDFDAVVYEDMSDDELLDMVSWDDESREELKNDMNDMREYFENKKILAFHHPFTGKITIFADRIKPETLEEVFFHENVHGIFKDIYGDELRDVAEHFWDVAPDEGLVSRKHITNDKSYSRDVWKEELLTYWLGKAMVQGRVGEVMDMLGDEDKEIINNILNAIGYDRTKEEPRRASRQEEVGLGETERTSGSVLRPSDGQMGRETEEVEPPLFREDEEPKFSVADDEEPVEPISFENKLTQATLKAVEDNQDSMQKKVDAVQRVVEQLEEKMRRLRNGERVAPVAKGAVGTATRAQKYYDQSTVKDLVEFAKVVMDAGMMDSASKGEMKRLLNLTKGVVGKEQMEKSLNAVADLIIDHSLRECKDLLKRQLSTKGKKVDAKGVEVQGALDVEGQRVLKALKEGMLLDEEALSQRMAEVEEKIGNEDETVASQAEAEYEGLKLAKQYFDDIKKSEIEERQMKHELQVVKDELSQKGEPSGTEGSVMDRESFKEFEREVEENVRKNKIERVEAYQKLVRAIGQGQAQSFERAKAFKEAEKERVREIQHNANSDLQGTPATTQNKLPWVKKMANNVVTRFLMQPVATFDEMLRYLGKKSPEGRGYLWNRFMTQWTDAADKEWKNLRAAHEELDAKVREIFPECKRWSDLFTLERKMPGADVTYWDADGQHTYKLTAGNLLYIYMVNKMSDGRMKLRKMGIKEEDVEDIKNALDPRLIELADWIQNDFLVQKRNDYNAVHKRMFGADMASIDNYFPLKIDKNALPKQEDLSAYEGNTETPSTITGSVIKRTKNAASLDLVNADAFDVVLDHLQQMEHWAAFAEFNRDLNTLLSYKHFKNQLRNMSSLRFGAGDTLLDNFRRVSAIAGGAYRPKVSNDSVDRTMVNMAKGVTTAKISVRMYTAFKQLLSYGAYLSEANLKELAKSSTPWGAYQACNWAMENLPLFAERWQSRQAGDTRLQETDSDWDVWKTAVVKTVARYGMTPNAAVDALTVAMGAKAVYETALKRYKKDGFDEATAEKKALRDASVAYNETQQSSKSAFTSAVQLDRTAAATAISVFRNASMAYQRRLLRALAQLKYKTQSDYKESSIAFTEKLLGREGLDEEQAKKAAERIYRISVWRNLADVAIFGYVLQWFWNLAPYLPYLLAGDDDEQKDKMLEDVTLHSFLGGIEGLSGGNFLSETLNYGRQALMAKNNDELNAVKQKARYQDLNLLPLMSDAKDLIDKSLQGDGAAFDMGINLLAQSMLGVNPQTFADGVASVLDAFNGDMGMFKEFAFAMARIMQAPKGAMDMLYIDELGMFAGDAKKMRMEDLAKRWAKYKFRQERPYTGWMLSEEAKQEKEEKLVKRFEEKVKERIADMEDEEVEKLLLGASPGMEQQMLEKEMKKRYDAEAEELEGAALDKAFDEAVFRMERKTLAKQIAKDAGASEDPYGDSTDNEYAVLYQELRLAEDVKEDALLLKAQEDAKNAGDDQRKKQISQGRESVMSARQGLGHGRDEEVMKILRENRRKLIQKLGL